MKEQNNNSWTKWELKQGSTRTMEEVEAAERALNSHAALVEALEAARKLLSEPDSGGYCVAPDSVIFTQINAALKLAKGEA